MVFFVEHCRITNSLCIPNFYYHTNLHGPLILLSSLVECLWMLQGLERCYQDSGIFHVRCLVQACLSINDWWWTFIENLRCPSSTYHQSFCNDTSCMHVLCHISPRPINFNKTKNTKSLFIHNKKSAPPEIFTDSPEKNDHLKRTWIIPIHPFSGDFPSVFLPLRLHTSCMVPVMAASLIMQVVSLPNCSAEVWWMRLPSLHRKQVRFGSDDVASVQTAARLRTSKDLPQVRRGFKDEHQIQSMKHGLKWLKWFDFRLVTYSNR